MVAPYATRRPDPRHIHVPPAVAAACRQAPSWVPDERHPPAPEQRFIVHPRFSSSHALFQHLRRALRHIRATARPAFDATYAAVGAASGAAARLARRDARITLGAAAVIAVIAAALAAGLAGGGSGIDAAEHVAPAQRTVHAKDAAADRSHSAAPKHAAPKHAAPKKAAPQHSAPQHSAPKHSAPKHSAPKHSAPRHDAARHHAVRHHRAPHHGVRHHGPIPRRPYLIYDSVTPSAIASRQNVAAYANGNYAASPAEVGHHRSLLWIDITGYDHNASVLDVEPGDATPSLAASWAWHRLQAHPTELARIYTMRSMWPAVRAAVAHLPARMRSHVRYWIADPTGSPHIVPGSAATQWYWGSSYDITSATPRF
jgi:hypothetical protein